MKKTKNLVQGISKPCEEQTLGSESINTAILELNNIAQHNALASDELSESTNIFLKQSKNLKQLISFFKIN